MSSNRFLSDARVPLLGSTSIQSDTKREFSQGDTKAVIIAINDEKKIQRLVKTLDLTKTKTKRKKCAEFILQYDIPIKFVLTMAIGGTASFLIWKYYWSHQQDLISDLRNQAAFIHSQWDANPLCPGVSYWKHPEKIVTCRNAADEKDKYQADYLLEQKDYCHIRNCDAYDFVEQVRKNLPLLCIPIMNHLCEVLADLQQEEARAAITPILMIIATFLLAAGITNLSYLGFKWAGFLSVEEEAEAKDVLQIFGVAVEDSRLVLPALEQLHKREQILKDPHYLPDDILNLVLIYANLSPKYFIALSDELRKSHIWKEVEEKENVKTLTEPKSEAPEEDEFKHSKNRFRTLFKKISNDPYTYHELNLVKGTGFWHKRVDLDAESVANRIFQFAGFKPV